MSTEQQINNNDHNGIRSISERKIIQLMEDLGFKNRGDYYWYHPVLGADNELNWFCLDPATDKPMDIVLRLYKGGYREGQFITRQTIKKALDI